MVIKQEEIDKAANKFLENTFHTITSKEICFKAGVEFAESKFEEIAIEFTVWHEDLDYNYKLAFSAEELYQQFIKERHEK